MSSWTAGDDPDWFSWYVPDPARRRADDGQTVCLDAFCDHAEGAVQTVRWLASTISRRLRPRRERPVDDDSWPSSEAWA
ncbi:MAG: hypothetical protein U0893_19985 [Chloroflexota bacterium]